MALSSAPKPTKATVRLGRRHADGAPVYGYRRLPGLPAVSVLRFPDPDAEPAPTLPDHAHAHDFLVLAYVEAGGGSMRVSSREYQVGDGDVVLIAPGQVIEVGHVAGLEEARAWAAFFPPDVLAPSTPAAFLSWRAHPLLFPFVRGAATGAQRLRVPPGDRAALSERFATLDRELRERRDGYAEAVLAHLTLLLVDVSRLAADVAGDLAGRDEPLLAAVFDTIEARYAEPISLDDVAAAVRLTPGHLTTVVGRKTGRTVQQWITERRMAEARRLLAGTDLTVRTVGARVGYHDVSYFIRCFRRSHRMTPLDWRRAGA